MSTPCQAEPDLWFSNNPDDIFEAKTACSTCPIVNACASMALKLQPSDGIWAGKVPDERPRTHGYRRVAVDEVARARRMRAAGMTWREVAQQLDVGLSAIQKAVERAVAAEAELGRVG